MKRALLLALFVGLGGPSAHAATDCSSVNGPDMLVLAGGTPQWTKLGTPFATPFEVTLANSNGCPVTTGLAGVPVTFTAPSTGAGGTFASSGSNTAVVGTGASGAAAAPQFTANRTAGDYSIVATSEFGSVTFPVTNTANGVPATIARASSADQSAKVNSSYRPLRVTVRDGNGAPVPGATVTFSLGGASGATTAGASFDGGGAQATAITDDTGTAASPGFTANDTAGTFTASASTPGITQAVTFALRNLAAGSPRLVAVGSARQLSTVGKRYADVLRVRLVDGAGKPTPNATVTFSLGGGGNAAAGATFAGAGAQATAVTDTNGLASSPRVVAGTVAGAFTASATATGAANIATFSLRNVAGAVAKITAGAAASESTTVHSGFPVPLAVTVEDANGNPVEGARVVFSAPPGAGSFAPHRARTVVVRTDTTGVAVAPRFVAGARPGGYAVTASVGRLRAAFALTNLAP